MTKQLLENSMQSGLERMAYFSSILQGLKERKLVSEIMQRELLLMLIDAHQDNIVEYPLLSIQQQSIIDIITIRSASDERLTDYIDQLVEIFINELTNFSRLKISQDDLGPTVQKLVNCETLLLKCVQGVCYTLALCQDNFYEVCLRRFGKEANDIFDRAIEEQSMDEGFWRSNFTEYLGKKVPETFDLLIKKQIFSLNKTGNKLMLTYKLDDLLALLRGEAARIQKSELQKSLDGARCNKEPQKSIYKHIHSTIIGMVIKEELIIDENDIDFVAQIVCLDPAAAELTKVNTEGLLSNGEEATSQDALFIRSQIKAIASSITLSISIMREDFMTALTNYDYYSSDLLRADLGDFSLLNLDKALYSLIEQTIAYLLRNRCAQHISKMQIYATRLRRTPKVAIENLFEQGMTKIRRNKIWTPDPDSEENMLFAPKNLTQLREVMQLLQVEPSLQKSVLKLWNQSWFKVEFNVAILLNLLAQTTTNLNYRLEEILSGFGVRLA